MNTHRGRRQRLALAIGILVAAPTLVGGVTPARAATSTVIERGTQFVSKQVTIAPGDTVVWTFESGPSPGHTVTFDDGTDLNPNCPPKLLGISDCQDEPGESVHRQFTTAGTYSYFCRIHRGSGMVGVVVVSVPSTTTTTSSSSTTTVKATSTTLKPSTSSTTSTTRALATSSTLASSSTTSTTSDGSSALLPGDPPPFSDDTSKTASRSSDSKGGSGSGTVALIVGLLLAVSAGGGLLLWRLRPGRP